MVELELTYLAKELPAKLAGCDSKEIIDLYVENGTDHADLRIRKNGDQYELTRKIPVKDGDASAQTETTIPLTAKEFASMQSTRGRKVAKTRYFYAHQGMVAEFNVFSGDLQGLVVVDFEFSSESAKESFVMPDFCLADITQETFIAGGVLAGKTYEDIRIELDQFMYEALHI